MKHSRGFALAIALGSAFATGCGGGLSRWQRTAVDIASVEHDCPREQITMMNWLTQGYSATAVMNVCGSRRIYRDYGGQTSYAWHEETPTAGN